MNCDDFRIEFDKLNDSRIRIERSGLSSDMIAHLEKCADCAAYFETMNIIQTALLNMRQEKVPPDLYWRLVRLEKKYRTINWITSVRPVVVHTSKILVPAFLLWIIALFVPEPVRVIIEMLTSVFGLTLMFERMGQSLITNRI